MYQVQKECTFFGASDRITKVKEDGTVDSHIGSSYPDYMHEPHIQNLRDRIDEKESMLSSGSVHPGEIEATKRRLLQEKTKLAKIEETRPQITPEMYGKISTELDRLSPEISSAMFTEIDMEKGHADAHKEAKRMRLPCVKVDKELAKRCNVDVDGNGKATRSQAERMWKILTYLKTDGEGYLNVDTLRKRMGGSVAPKSRLSANPEGFIGFDKDGNILKDQNVTLDTELENKEITMSQRENPMWTCPDCKKDMKASGKSIHKSRWCKARKEQPVGV